MSCFFLKSFVHQFHDWSYPTAGQDPFSFPGHSNSQVILIILTILYKLLQLLQFNTCSCITIDNGDEIFTSVVIN